MNKSKKIQERKTKKAPTLKIIDGHMVVDLGYKTNSLDLLREYCGRGSEE